jgi:hypothetical protein
MAATITITDLGSDIQFSFSNGHEYTLNKISARTHQDDTYVYITNADSYLNAADNKVIRLRAEDVSSPTFADNGALLTYLLSLITSNTASGGGAGAGGGGNNTWSNAQSDFTATPTVGTKDIVLSGLGFTLEEIHVVSGSIKKIDSSGDVTDLALTNVVVSGNTITLGAIEDFVAGDTVLVVLFGEDKAYDGSTDSQLVTSLNPNYEHYTSVENIISETNQINGAVTRYVIPSEAYNFLSLHIKSVAGTADDTVTIDVFYTNNDLANNSADTNWINASTDVLGGQIVTNNITNENMYIVDTPHTILKWMVKVSYAYTGGGSASNSVDVYLKKSS